MIRSRIVGKALALSILLALGLPFALAIPEVIQKYRDGQSELADAVDRFDKIRAIANFDADKLSLDDHGAGLERVVLGLEPQAVLVARLLARLREAASQQGVEILQASDLLPTDVHPGLKKIGTRLQVVGLYGGLLEFFRQIGESTPMLIVENIEIHSAEAEGNPIQVEPPLTAALDVWGLVPDAPAAQPQ